MKDSRCFVQFIHPGKEHEPDTGSFQNWNRGPHRRRFVRSRGRVEGDPTPRDLMFWCEWEPPSTVLERVDPPVAHGPTRVWTPHFAVPESYAGLQNTDPFVFDGFIYSICKQTRTTGPTQLRNLSRGSVILFGSHVAGSFVLDTVFVVRDFVDHTVRDYDDVLHGRVSEEYLAAGLRPYYENFEGPWAECLMPKQSLRLYIGATDDEPYEGMFSYFPCGYFERGTRGFARPAIELGDAVSQAARQSGRLNRDVLPIEIQRSWRNTKEQVERAGCEIGVWAEMPSPQMSDVSSLARPPVNQVHPERFEC